jgi:hypothetical protein
MKIAYTIHARDRLKGRNISKREVEDAIKSGKKTDASNDSRMSVLKNKKGVLVVIYNIKGPGKILGSTSKCNTLR